MIQISTDELNRRFLYCAETGIVASRRTGRPLGRLTGNGYLAIAVRQPGRTVTLLAHRVAWQMHHGTPAPRNIDHRNRDKADNRIDNLRLCDQTQNQGNYLMRSNNKSGVRGVHWSEHHQKWVAQIRQHGKTRRIGGFTNISDAAKAYQDEYERLFGEFAVTS